MFFSAALPIRRAPSAFECRYQSLQALPPKAPWLSPESPYLWGTGDSDLHAYVPFCDSVHEVANLQQLSDAVDRLLG